MYTPVFQQDGNCYGQARRQMGMALAESGCASPCRSGVWNEPAAAASQPVTGATPADAGLWLWATGLILLAVAAADYGPFGPQAGRRRQRRPYRCALTAAVGPDNAVRIIAGYDRKVYRPSRPHLAAGPLFRWRRAGRRRHSASFSPAHPTRCSIKMAGSASPATTFPLNPGTYEMKLHFVEPVYGPGLETGGGENSRVFDILVNGKLAIDGFDIVSDAGGPLIADVRVFKDIQPGPDGILRLGFHARREQPIISAIEIEPAEPHRLNPIRIVTQPNSVTDSHGQVWEADNYYSGGQTSNHFKVGHRHARRGLVRQRAVRPLLICHPGGARHVYASTMYFAETYWGKENEGGGGAGQRVFDIYCNGSAHGPQSGHPEGSRAPTAR